MVTRRETLGLGAGMLLASAAGARTAKRRPQVSDKSFPKGFRWGAATAGHQVEGNNIASDLWVMEHVQPTYYRTPSGDACDSLNRWPEDLDLVKAFGLDTYRFSIEWSRIEPAPGQFSQAMLDLYSRMIDGCLKRGIAPFVTFNHFTAPAWFAGLGHWTDPSASDRFATFCDRAARTLADRIAYAATLNEPNTMRLVPYISGRPIPAAARSRIEAASAAAIGASKFGNFMFNDPEAYLEQTLAGHAKGFDAIKAVRRDLPVGVCLAIDDDQAVGDPAKRDRKRADVNGAWLAAAKAKSDFVGVQNYTRRQWSPAGLIKPAPEAMVDLDMEYYPDSLGNAVDYVYREVGKPIFVTENGVATHDDAVRARYIPAALAGLKRAIDGGVPVMGYIHWTLIDNFEWAAGYDAIFGLASVDRTTFKRTPKPSAQILARIARTNALV
jgi:beta-glucosidase